MLSPQRCWLQFTTIVTLLCILTAPALSQKVDFTNLTLIETTTNSTLSTLESETISTKYTLSNFLSKVVAKTGFSTTSTTDEDQGLRYYQTGFRWDPEEEANSSHWQPLSVSTWQDSVLNGTNAELASVNSAWKGVTVVSWKDTTTNRTGGVRVTFVVNGTAEEGTPRKYAHVLLVNNVARGNYGGVTFDTINPTNFLGGIVWYGRWLYVGDGMAGLRVFDMSHIWKVDSKDAFGMEYILPQARMYSPSGFPLSYRSFTFDFMSIDRNSTPPSLLVGEYEDNTSRLTYLAKWPLDGSKGLLATMNVDGKLVARANWGYKISVLCVRGMVFAHKKYYIGRLLETTASGTTGDMNERGELYIWAPGQYVDPIKRSLPRGVGGMAYSPDGDKIWAVGATEGSRGVVGINAGGYAGKDIPTVTNPTPTPTSYTSQTPKVDNSKNSGGSTRTIVGGVIGGIAGSALFICLFFVYRRKAARDAERQLTSQGADQYPPPGFAQGTDEYYHKPELDASSTQVGHAGYAAAVARSGSGEHIGALEEWEKKKAMFRMPARKPVPMATPAVYDGRRGEGPWVELPAVEKPVQAP